jgi:hypothetical protein
MFRRFIILFLALILSWTTIGYAKAETTIPSLASNVVKTAIATPQVNDQEQYPVQQVTYDDATGEYSVVLLNTPPGTPPVFRSPNLQMARLSDEEIQAGQQSYLKVENRQPVLYLTEDFKIEYVHAVTDQKTNLQTGQPETVVVRRETGFWTPFAGALAGQAIGNLLFRPQYYVPPVYQPGVSVLRGFGGYGNSYGQAVERYQSRYNAPPLAVRNRPRNFRTTGRIRTPGYGQPMPRRSPGGFSLVLVMVSRCPDALLEGLVLVMVSRCPDVLCRVTTLVIALVVRVTVGVPYAHLAGQVPAIDDHHLVVLAVAVLLVLAEAELVVDGVSKGHGSSR